MRERVARYREAANRLKDAPGGDETASLHHSLEATHRVLADGVPAPGLPPGEHRAAWRRFRLTLAAAYTDLSRDLEAWDLHVPSLRPTNYARNVLHVSGAALAILILEAFPDPDLLIRLAGGFCALGWSLEASRRISPRWNDTLMWFFGPVAHPHERHRVNSATWYCTSLLLLALLKAPAASLAGLVALGVGDPLAAILGRRYGKHRFANGRSVEGTSAFVLGTLVVGFLLLSAVHPELGAVNALAVIAAAAGTGAFVELTSRRIDDNVAIPVSASLGALLALQLLS